MSKEVEEAMERLERAQNDICYATLYSQEEQDKDIETVLNYIKELKKEVREKDKTILKMAKVMNNFDIDEDICKQMGQKKYCSEYDEESECEKCIIEYFEKKEG